MSEEITVYGWSDCGFSTNFKTASGITDTVTSKEETLTAADLTGAAKTLNFTYVDCKTATSDTMCPRINAFPSFVHGAPGSEKICKKGFAGEDAAALKSAAVDVANALGDTNTGCTEAVPPASA